MRNAFSSHILGTVQENQMRGKKVPVLGGSKIRGKVSPVIYVKPNLPVLHVLIYCS